MSLLVWLPLNGNLENRGLLGGGTSINGSTITYNTSAVNTNGKIGKCYCGTINYCFNDDFLKTDTWTISVWFNKASAYAEYNNIILCKNHSNSTDCQFYLSVISNNTLNIGVGTANYLMYNSSFQPNIWYHIAASYNGNTIKLYLNGVLVTQTQYTYTRINTNNFCIGGRSDNTTGTSVLTYDFYLNDVRIYDHCLGEKEIKQISQGLILHYSMDDPYIESTTNIARYPTPGSPVGAIGWDQSKHQNAIYVSNWASGYNSGVQVPATGYHACWKMIEDIPTMVFVDRNSDIGYTHRWLGISGGIYGTEIPSNTTYTVSFDAKSDVTGKGIMTGVYYRRTSSDSYNFHDSLAYFYLTKNWKRYSYTRTTQTVDNISSLYMYGHGDYEGTAYVRNLQVELKDHATPYTISTRTNSVVYDSSGYENNGTAYDSFTLSTDTARHKKALYFNGGNVSIGVGDLSIMIRDGIFTFTCWFNVKEFGSKGYGTIFGGPGGFEVESKSGGTNSPVLVAYNWGGGTAAYEMNKWNMLAMVRTTSDTKFYLNGELKITGSAGSIPSGSYFLGSWRSSAEQNYKGYMSDARIYATALSSEDIVSLYNKSATIDYSNAMYAYDYIENDISKVDIKKTGIVDSNDILEKNSDFYTEYSGNLLSYSNLRGHGSSWTLQSETYKSLPVYKNVVTSPGSMNNAGFSIINQITPEGLISQTKLTLSFYKRLNAVYGLNLGGYVTVIDSGGASRTYNWSYNKPNWANDSSSIGKWELIYSTVSIPSGCTKIQYMYVYYDKATGGDCDYCRIQLEYGDKPTVDDLPNVSFNKDGLIKAGRFYEI